MLSDLVSDTVATTEALARAKGVQLTGAAGGSPLVVHADPRELSRVLANLLINAVQHTPPAAAWTSRPGRRLTVHCWRLPTAAVAFRKPRSPASSIRAGAAAGPHSRR